MSFHLETYPGTGQDNTNQYHYSQAVKVGNIIRTSGQGGWDDKGNIVKAGKDEKDKNNKDLEVAKAFENAMTAVNAIDPNVTWKNVYAVRTFHLDLDKTFPIVVETFKRLFGPDHKPIWTCVQIGKLGIEGMAIEVEIEAAV